MSEEEFLKQLKIGSKCAYDYLYHNYYSGIEKYIVSNSGSKEDAQDIFQEALLILIRNIAKEEFELRASLKTYVYAISKKLWLKSLRNNNLVSGFTNNEIEIKDNSEEENDQNSEIIEFIDKVLLKVPHHCHEIVDYVFYQNVPIESAAEHLGYNNSHTASNMKYKCIQQMKKVSGKNGPIK